MYKGGARQAFSELRQLLDRLAVRPGVDRDAPALRTCRQLADLHENGALDHEAEGKWLFTATVHWGGEQGYHPERYFVAAVAANKTHFLKKLVIAIGGYMAYGAKVYEGVPPASDPVFGYFATDELRARLSAMSAAPFLPHEVVILHTVYFEPPD